MKAEGFSTLRLLSNIHSPSPRSHATFIILVLFRPFLGHMHTRFPEFLIATKGHAIASAALAPAELFCDENIFIQFCIQFVFGLIQLS